MSLAGCVGYISWKEKKREQKLENDKREQEIQTQKLENNSRIIKDCYAEIERLTGKMNEMETRYELVLRQKDARIAELEQKVKALEEELDGMKQKRNAKGQFVKK